MTGLLKDLRFALRMLARSPGTTLVAVLTLALAIAANTVIFSVVNAVLLRPLPYPEPEQLVMVLETQPEVERMAVPYPNYRDYEAGTTSFTTLAAMGLHGMTLTGRGEPEHLLAPMYSHDLLPALGVTPALGRNFLPEEDAPGGARAVILGHGLWSRRYGADPAILGQTITLDGRPYTVVGVLPADFRFFFAGEVMTTLGARADEAMFRDRAARPEIYMIGRMKPGVGVAQAQADLAAVADGLAARHPKEYGETRPLVLDMRAELTSDQRGPLMLLMGAVVLVLLIAVANVANLMLERAMRRQKEMIVRAALGATRWRLIRQLLVESALLALLAGSLGLLLSLWGVDVLAALRPRSPVDVHGPITIDAAVLAYTLSVALGTGALFGLVPALYATRQDLSQALKEADQHASAGSKHLRARSLLVIGEVALAMMLLVGAVLAVRGLIRTHSVDPGFDPVGVLHAGLSTTPVADGTPAQAMQFWEQARRNVAAIPGVVAVGWSPSAPFFIDYLDQFAPLGVEKAPENMRSAVTYVVSEGYLEALKIPLLSGRRFGPQDVAGTPPGVLIDKQLADAFFPGVDPVGQRLQDRLSGLASVEVIGVVGHVKQYGLDEPEKTPYQLYYAYAQLSEASLRQMRTLFMSLVVRFEGGLDGLPAQVRAAVAAADPQQPTYALLPMTEAIRNTLARRRYLITLLAAFAGLALVLAAVGVYAVMANTVVQRTRELGVRMALGAQPRAVVALVVGQGMRLVAVGLAIGIAGALALTRAMTAVIGPSISATDPPTFVGVALGLAAVGLLATLIPARRATRIDPMIALRHE